MSEYAFTQDLIKLKISSLRGHKLFKSAILYELIGIENDKVMIEVSKTK